MLWDLNVELTNICIKLLIKLLVFHSCETSLDWLMFLLLSFIFYSLSLCEIFVIFITILGTFILEHVGEIMVAMMIYKYNVLIIADVLHYLTYMV